MQSKKQLRYRRRLRIRAKVSGTRECPRLAVFRSNKALVVQLIDDTRGVTLASARRAKNNKSEAKALGEIIAQKAKTLGITRVVFDRGGFRYHGSIRELAESAREGGLKF